MALLGGLFARSSREEATNPEVGSSSEPEAERASEPEAGVRSPTDRLTGFQIFYIFGLDGIGAMVLSGGINFAVAYGRGPFPVARCPASHGWRTRQDVS